MNHIYRSIWNRQTDTFVAVSEIGGHAVQGAAVVNERDRVACIAGILVGSLMIAGTGSAFAQPSGGAVMAGSATISGSPASVTITQTTPSVAINWQSFGIKAGESVTFVQPGSSSVALNRVVGADPSNIFGSLSANGQVFLVNPNGVLFGRGASVNVAGLVASTLDISDADFNARHYRFTGSAAGSVINEGTIATAEGGFVALLGSNVANQGVITARLGSVMLAGGHAVTLDLAGDRLLSVTVDQGAIDALVANGGLIKADGGRVLMTTQAAGSLLPNAVNNSGVVQAQTLENVGGTIKLLAGLQSGTVQVGGRLDASAPAGGAGGLVETSAARVTLQPGAGIDTAARDGATGTWLIDPTDFTIAPATGDITGTQLSAQLVLNNVTIVSTAGAAGVKGDINVSDTVTWAANRLTLVAQNDIYIDAAMTGTGSASLSLLYGQAAPAAGNTSTYNVRAPVTLPAGSNFSTQQGANGVTINYTVITSLGSQISVTANDLQGMRGDLTGHYALGSNIDASAS
ncbi:MAG TPA: filamentous hemagglutinin N-terminal domain-containing protein, partial [Rubrivivax sp.]|nr:filamentous hemagglutinin N-terminal domain-containing protein [Rubrivivax sp.]